MDVEFTPNKSIASYDLCYKIYQQTWEEQKVKTIGAEELQKGGSVVKTAVENLEPGTTYAFRLVGKDSDGNTGAPGPEMVVDTEAVGCTPKPKSKSCSCVVL